MGSTKKSKLFTLGVLEDEKLQKRRWPKYCGTPCMEVSAALNHDVDALLVEIVKQIRIKMRKDIRKKKHKIYRRYYAEHIFKYCSLMDHPLNSQFTNCIAIFFNWILRAPSLTKSSVLLFIIKKTHYVLFTTCLCFRRRSAGVRVRGLVDRVLGQPAKSGSQSCDNLNVIWVCGAPTLPSLFSIVDQAKEEGEIGSEFFPLSYQSDMYG